MQASTKYTSKDTITLLRVWFAWWQQFIKIFFGKFNTEYNATRWRQRKLYTYLHFRLVTIRDKPSQFKKFIIFIINSTFTKHETFSVDRNSCCEVSKLRLTSFEERKSHASVWLIPEAKDSREKNPRRRWESEPDRFASSQSIYLWDNVI